MSSAPGFFTALQTVWHPFYFNTLLAALIMLGLLLRHAQLRTEQPHLLRNTLIFISLGAVCLLAAACSHWLHYPDAAGVLDALATLLAGLLVLRLAALLLFRVGLPALSLHPPRIMEDILLVLAFVVWGLIRLRYAGLDLGSLVATSAVITAILAFSMQDTLGNILGGIALQLDDSIHIGDWIKVDDVSGRVVEVHWRHTAVRTRNGEIVVLPNSLLMKSKFTIVSRADTPSWRRWVYFSLPLDIAPQRVIASVEGAISAAAIPLVCKQPAPSCVLMEFKDGIGLYALRYWLSDALADDPTDSAVRVHVYAALQREGWRFAAPTMAIAMASDDAESRAQQREKELALRRKTLRRITLFAQLADTEIEHLASTLTYAQFARGDVMTRQGAVAHWLYVLIKGEADVWFEQEGRPRRWLTTLPTGHVFGEMSLMTGAPRRATVTARTDAECYRIDKKNFEKLMQSRPEMADEFAHILTERNKLLVEIEEEKRPLDQSQQHATLLANIRHFFRLDNH